MHMHNILIVFLMHQFKHLVYLFKAVQGLQGILALKKIFRLSLILSYL